MPKYQITPTPGTLYVEPDIQSGLMLSGADDTGKMRLRIVRCGPEQVNDHGVTMPMKYKPGQIVVAFPKSCLPTPRGFVLHQDSVAFVLDETDGADEMQPMSMAKISDKDLKGLLTKSVKPIEA